LQVLSNNYIYDRAYVERLCNFYKTTEFKKGSFYEDPSKVSIDGFMKKLFGRVTYLPSLFSQIENFLKYKKYKKFLPEVLSKLKDENRYQLAKKKTEISDFVKISQNEYLEAMRKVSELDDEYIVSSIFEKDTEGNSFKRYIKMPVTKYNDEEAQYFLAIFERKGYKFKAYIEIGYDYPER
jgi:hypothetical protein